MNQLSFVGTYRTSPCILTEGAVVERLRREFHIPLDEDLIHAASIMILTVKSWQAFINNTLTLPPGISCL